MKKLLLILLLLPFAALGQDTLNVQAIVSDSQVHFSMPVQTDTVFAYSEPEVFRDINYQMIEDTTGAFAIRIHGATSANKIRYASKCIGVEYNTMTAVDERLGLSLEPDSTGTIDGTTRNYNCHYTGQNMNALMTYWLTAYTDTDTLFVRRFIDVAHIRNLGQ